MCCTINNNILCPDRGLTSAKDSPTRLTSAFQGCLRFLGLHYIFPALMCLCGVTITTNIALPRGSTCGGRSANNYFTRLPSSSQRTSFSIYLELPHPPVPHYHQLFKYGRTIQLSSWYLFSFTVSRPFGYLIEDVEFVTLRGVK